MVYGSGLPWCRRGDDGVGWSETRAGSTVGTGPRSGRENLFTYTHLLTLVSPTGPIVGTTPEKHPET